MNRRHVIGIIFTLSMVTSCGTTNTVKQAIPVASDGNLYQIADISATADVPEKFKSNLRKYLEKDLKKRGVFADGAGSHTVSVKITEFKMSTGVSRILLGGLSGADYVKAQVTVLEKASNQVVGDTTIESKDKLASGGPELFTSYHAKAISEFLQ